MEVFPEQRKNYKSVLAVRANAVSDFRIDLAARHLSKAGFEVEVITQVPFYKASQFDIILCCRPGISMIEFLKVCLLAGKRVVVDLDDDFNAIPKHNPAYNYTGAGHATYLYELKKLLNYPGVIVTYASAELAKRYKVDGVVIPNYWDEENPNWYIPKRTHPDYVTLGFSGTTTHREDFNIIEPALKKVFNDYPHLRFVSQLDDSIYTRFLDLPEERKLFIPPLLYIDYPLMYSYIDILLVPLRDTHFNRAKSDIKLLECGASKTPYVASDMPFYHDWGVGGGLVKTTDWDVALPSMVENWNPEVRQELGEQGHTKALTRTSAIVCNKWIELVEELSQ